MEGRAEEDQKAATLLVGSATAEQLNPSNGAPGVPTPIKTTMTPPDAQEPVPSIPQFLTKLFDICEDPSSNHLIRWAPDGKSFIVAKQSDFCDTILPKHFKHSNFSSFIRQLNIYGFRKNREDKGHEKFEHPSFQSGKRELLRLIRRKTPQPSTQTQGKAINWAMDEVEMLKKEIDQVNRASESLREEMNSLRSTTSDHMAGVIYQFNESKKMLQDMKAENEKLKLDLSSALRHQNELQDGLQYILGNLSKGIMPDLTDEALQPLKRRRVVPS